MPHVEIDPTIERVEMNGFPFPLGVYPVEPVLPKPGYVEEFEPADGGTSYWHDADAPDEDWEEWPDRIMFDVLLPPARLRTFCRSILAMLPSRVFPILDVLGNDAFREVDPYIAYDPVGLDRLFDGVRSFGDWLYEDGLVGFGAMSLEPFIYIFVDEHKIATVRVELALKERIEALLGAFELHTLPEVIGADAAAHEHRGVLLPPDPADEDAAGRVTAEEIIDRLRRSWNLQLNIDRTQNLDDEGKAIGPTYWRALVRCLTEEDGPGAFAEVVLSAPNYDEAETIAMEAAAEVRPGKDTEWTDIEAVTLDRITPKEAAELTGSLAAKPSAKATVHRLEWIMPDADEPTSAD